MDDDRNSDPRPLILATLGGGGWHRQTHRILEQWSAETFRFAYVYAHHSGNRSASRLAMPHPGPRYPIRYLGPRRKRSSRFVLEPVRFVASLLEALRLVRRLRPQAILAIAHSAAAPLVLAGKLCRIRCVFVESLTRVDDLSLAGRIIYHLGLAARQYVQWPSLQR